MGNETLVASFLIKKQCFPICPNLEQSCYVSSSNMSETLSLRENQKHKSFATSLTQSLFYRTSYIDNHTPRRSEGTKKHSVQTRIHNTQNMNKLETIDTTIYVLRL